MDQALRVGQKRPVDLKRRVENLRRLKRIETALNRVQRAARIGNYWYWVEVPELQKGMDIAALVCPLRYDVLVRRDFFPFFEANRALAGSDWKEFVAMTKGTSYYAWFMESEAVRTNIEGKGDQAALDAQFERRVRRSIELYESFEREGYSTRFPLVLKTAERLLPPTTDRRGPFTGKQVSSRFFIADGCHRLALLMAKGFTILPADYFRVKCFREFSPFDSTSLLVRRLSVEPGAYFRYLSSYYAAPLTFDSRAEFLAYIREHKPQLLAEVRSAIRVDGYGEGENGNA